MNDEPANPFQSSRLSLPVSSSLLSYGEDSFSFSRMLGTGRTHRTNSTILTHRDAEQRIINRIEKEMYTLDDSGHCLAERSFDELLTQDEDRPQDFWEKIKTVKPKKQLSNPFGLHFENRSFAKKSSLYEKTTTSKISHREQLLGPKSSRKTARLEMAKLKEITKKEKLKEEHPVAGTERFSLVEMYKSKRQQQAANAQRREETASQPPAPQPPEFITVRGVSFQRVELHS